MSPRLPLACIAAVLALLPSAPSQGVDLPGRQGPPKNRGRLDLPDAPPPEPVQDQPEEGAPEGQRFFLEPANRYEEVFARFELEPKHEDAVLDRYLDELYGLGLETRETAVKALGSPIPAEVRLAARLLESVGLPEDAETLVLKASAAGQVSATVACLETALRLRGGHLPVGAVRLLDHPRRSVRAAVETRLAAGPDPSHRVPLLQRLRFGRDLDVRLRAARLLGAFADDGEVRQALLQVLEDEHVSLAFAAAAGLAGTGNDAEVDWLREQVVAGPPGPRTAYLLHALLKFQEEQGRLLVTESAFPVLRKMLVSPEPFVAGTAAAALAEHLFRTPGESPLEAEEGSILQALVRSVSGVPFYPQYARFAPLAEHSLERITGEDLAGSEPSAWLEWLAAHRAGFHAVRATLPVREEDIARLVVRWSVSGGGERVMAGPASGVAPGPRARLLGRAGLGRLLEALESAGVLDAAILPGTYGPEGEARAAALSVAVGDRAKRLAFRGSSGLSWLPGLLASLEDAWAEQLWQVLAPEGGEAVFVMENLEAWDGLAAEARGERMVRFSLGRLASAPDAGLAAWLEALAETPGLEARWDPALSAEILGELARRHPGPDLGPLMVRAALLRPVPSLVGPLVDALAEREEPLRSDLLLLGLSRLGPEACASCLGDERLPVRVAAARALGQAGPAARTHLRRALEDRNPLVVKMALRSLGELRDPEDLELLRAHAAPGGNREVRKEALWALGNLGDPQVLPVLRDAARDPDAGVRLAAIDALGRIPGHGAEDALSGLFPSYVGTFLEVPFLQALERRGAAAARRVLAPHLGAPDLEVARRAAVMAGRLGDPAAAPYLMGMLPERPRDAEILDALAAATGADYRGMPDPAGVYAFWWRDHGTEGADVWLALAARQAGLDLPDHFTDARQVPRPQAIRALLHVLEEGPSHLRAAAAYHLHTLTGVDSPALHGSTPESVVRHAASGWEAWLAGQGEG